MSKLLSVLVAGLFAAGAYAQTPTPAPGSNGITAGGSTTNSVGGSAGETGTPHATTKSSAHVAKTHAKKATSKMGAGASAGAAASGQTTGSGSPSLTGNATAGTGATGGTPK